MPVNQKFPKYIHLYDMKGRGEGDRRKKRGRKRGGRCEGRKKMERRETLLLTKFTQFNTL